MTAEPRSPDRDRDGVPVGYEPPTAEDVSATDPLTTGADVMTGV